MNLIYHNFKLFSFSQQPLVPDPENASPLATCKQEKRLAVMEDSEFFQLGYEGNGLLIEVIGLSNVRTIHIKKALVQSQQVDCGEVISQNTGNI